ncbi:hypothetical protein [Halorussus halophilus]|uniref:hypothetical protein n=1 Tax=Halorussus halophilus TaxID=2650975 RepID=UPI001300E2EB
MSPPEDESASPATGPPDRQTLQLLERQLASDSRIAETEFDPDSYEPRLLHATLDAERYPDSIAIARLDIRWFTTDDFSIHYIENHDAAGTDTWECRWDRHPNTHNARLHFHRPPDAEKITDLSLSSLHPLDVYSTVLTAIEQRIETLWSTQ